MNIGVTRWDAAELLTSDEMIVAYVDACIDEAGGDPTLVLTALGDVARARGIPELVRELSNDRDPSFAAVMKVMKGLRLRFRVEIA